MLKPELPEVGEGTTSTPLPRAGTYAAQSPKSSRCLRIVGDPARRKASPGPGYRPDHIP